MSNLVPVSSFDAVYQFDPTDPIQGGPGGIDNQPHQSLLNRTQWLRDNMVSRAQPQMDVPVDEGASAGGKYRIGLQLGNTPDSPTGQYALIPLCRADATLSDKVQIVNGTFRFARGGAGSFNSLHNVDVLAQRAYNAFGGSLRSNNGIAAVVMPFKLVTATIGGVSYLCLTKGLSSAEAVYFDGFSYDRVGDAVLLTMVPNTAATNIADYQTSESFGPTNGLIVDISSNVKINGTTLVLGPTGQVAALAVDASNTTYLRGAQIAFQNASGNGEWMHIQNNGFVGIGTSTQAFPLHLFAGANAIFRLESQQNGVALDILANGPAATGLIGTTSNHPLQIFTAGVPRINIDIAGQVNIGNLQVTGPYGLAVSGPLVFDARAAVNGIIGSQSTNDFFITDTNKVVGSYSLSWKSFSDATGGPTAVLSGYGGIRFFTANSQQLVISAGGEVGFGKLPTPGYRADVLGTVRSIGGESITGYGFRVLNNAQNGGGFLNARSGASAGITLGGDSGPVVFASAGASEVGRFDASGNFLVGQPGNQLNFNDFFTASRAVNGFQKMPGGVILQWGSFFLGDIITGANPWRTTTVNFPISFPNACRFVSPMYYDANAGQSGIFSQLIGISNTSFTHQIAESSGIIQSASIFWFAVGY